MKLSEKKVWEKKEKILLSAVAIVNRRGYEGATMEEIAAGLQMTKSSLYYYFKSKSDLMYQCHNLVFSEATKELEEALLEKAHVEEIIRNMVFIHIEYAIEEKATFNMLMEPSQIFSDDQLKTVLQLRKYYSSLFDQAIEKGIASGEFEVKEPIIVRMMILGAMNWIQQWYRPYGRMSKDDVKEHFVESILKLLKK